MTLKLEDKKAIVADVADVAGKALSAVIADYRGLTVAEMTELRAKARQAGVYLRVVRNTLARKAVKETDYACLDEVLTGPLFLAFSLDEPGAAAKLLRDFVKNHENLEVKALSIGGKLLTATDLGAVADLPNREQALAMLMGVMLAPVTKFVRTMVEPYAQVTRAMAAVRDQKQG
ncbi:MAG: 50S ribosomal protein L10 [Gammaproteobacteria bacterium]|nr:50S ribosomal protein L10 [Gammaproteobacteria bacterium]